MSFDSYQTFPDEIITYLSVGMNSEKCNKISLCVHGHSLYQPVHAITTGLYTHQITQIVRHHCRHLCKHQHFKGINFHPTYL